MLVPSTPHRRPRPPSLRHRARLPGQDRGGTAQLPPPLTALPPTPGTHHCPVWAAPAHLRHQLVGEALHSLGWLPQPPSVPPSVPMSQGCPPHATLEVREAQSGLTSLPTPFLVPLIMLYKQIFKNIPISSLDWYSGY